METRLQHLDAGTLIFIGLFVHLIFFLFTNTWFRKDLTDWTKKQPITHVTLFILSNLWPLTWTAYAIYAGCTFVGRAHQQKRLQDLVDENNRLTDELAALKAAVNVVNQSYEARCAELAALRVHQESHRKHLPPYTPDLNNSIRNLELKLEGAAPSELLKRIFVIEDYLAKWDASGTWIEHIQGREAKKKDPL